MGIAEQPGTPERFHAYSQVGLEKKVPKSKTSTRLLRSPGFSWGCAWRWERLLTGSCIPCLHAGLSLCPTPAQRPGKDRSPPTSCLLTDTQVSPERSQLGVWRVWGFVGEEGDSKWLSLTTKMLFYNFLFNIVFQIHILVSKQISI